MRLAVVAAWLALAGCAMAPQDDAPTVDATAAFEALRGDADALADLMRRFPKGGDIHHHLIGTPTPDLFMDVGAMRGFCLVPATLEARPGPCTDDTVAFAALGQRDDLRERLRDAWSLRALTPGDDNVPAHFFGVFPQIWSLSHDRGLLLARLKRDASAQNILYLETQLQTPAATDAIRGAAMAVGEGDDVMALRQALTDNGALSRAVDQSLNDLAAYDATARRELGCDAQPDAAGCDVAHRYQVYALRILPRPMVLADMILAFELAARSPMVVGVNVVGFEGDPNSLANYADHMAALGALRAAYPTVRLALHAGELTAREAGAGALRSHVPDAVYVARAHRIGHGNAIATSAARPELLRYLADNNITVELSLSSNHWLLGLAGEAHHLPLLWDAGVPFTLNTDDAGIFVTDLSREYALAAKRYRWLDYGAFVLLTRRSLEAAFIDGESLWASIGKGVTVADCAVLDSARCDAFVARSPRARLQRELERRLDQFELGLRSAAL